MKKWLKISCANIEFCFYVLPFLLLLMGCLFLRGWCVWVSLWFNILWKTQTKFQMFWVWDENSLKLRASGIYVNASLRTCVLLWLRDKFYRRKTCLGMEAPFLPIQQYGWKMASGVVKGGWTPSSCDFKKYAFGWEILHSSQFIYHFEGKLLQSSLQF